MHRLRPLRADLPGGMSGDDRGPALAATAPRLLLVHGLRRRLPGRGDSLDPRSRFEWLTTSCHLDIPRLVDRIAKSVYAW